MTRRARNRPLKPDDSSCQSDLDREVAVHVAETKRDPLPTQTALPFTKTPKPRKRKAKP